MIKVHWSRLAITVIASLGIAIAATGLAVSRNRSPAQRMQRTPPHRFFTDPLQIRLADAVDRGDDAAVAAAVRDGADVNARGSEGFALMYWAIARDRVSGFESLMKHGADVTLWARDPALMSDPRFNRRLIRLLVSTKNPGFLEAALRQGLDPDSMLGTSSRESLLFGAIRDHCESAVRTLLDAGADINFRNGFGETPMIEAGMYSDYKIAWYLLQRGADPTVADRWGHDFVWGLREYGSRGVRPDHRESFEAIVDELVRRGLLTREDIVEADKPKQSVFGRPPGVTVIEHSPNSEAGQAIRRLDEAERRANRRNTR